MGEVTWTPEQERAITFRGGAAIVSAAAGSGKTAVLVERVKRLILDEKDPVNADAMVISTFTNEAASELKERLAKAIDDEMKKDPGNKRLLEQRLRLEDAHISTISSFCLNILRRSSTLTGLQPGFGVLDESEARLIYNESLNTVMEDFCENGDPAERDRVFDWFAGETDKRITDAVDTLYRFSRSLPDADTFFDDQLSLFRSPVEASESGSKAADRFFRRSVLGTVHALQELYGKVLTVTAGTPGERYAVQLGAICGEAEKITDENSCTEVYDGFLRDTDMPACPRKSKNYDNSAVRELHELIKPVFARLKLNAGLFARRKSDLAACEPILGTLISLVRKTEAEYSSRKRDKNRVDFNDIELMTLKLLRGGNGVRSEAAEDIAKDIKVIIVDEFQDSNEIQYEIFRLLSDDRKNLFFVGDIKQSIYRFRGADPLVFSRLTKDPEFTVIPLNRNFRSCDQVIDSVNGIFNDTMTEELGDVDYNESCALVRGTAFDTDDDLNRTELITFSSGSAEASRLSEAAYIADRIKCMVRDKFPVSQKNGVKRPCKYSDFAVLMGRYSSNIHIYKDAFDQAGVPYDAKDSGGYTDNAEIVHALSLLKVIDDPYRDTDLATVLMLPPYMLDEKEMAAIKLAGGKNRSLWTGLGKRAATDPRAKKIFDEINAFRRFADENSAERLIRKICDESLLIPASEASPDGERRSTNLRRLIFCAENFTGGVSASLYDFIRYMENVRKSRISLTQAKGGSEDAVRIMTIHGSKGLEFPVCFVSNLSSRQDSDSSEIICDPVYGIGMKINDREKLLKIDTGTYNMVSEENARLDMSEEMRLLYVAATRAREKLIFTAPLSARGAPDMHYGWILGSGAVKSGLISVRNYESYQSAENEEKTDASEHEVRLPEFTEYRYRRYSEIPAKVTATEIGVRDPGERSGTSDRIDRFLRVPTFLGTQATARLTGKKRGDAYHKVMELLDFRAGVNDVPRILDSLRDSGKISEAERLSVSDDDIAAFLESGICRRAVASGDVSREFPVFFEYVPDSGEWSGISWENEEKPFIQGIADMFFIEDGEIVLVDYKTNTGVSPEELREEYRGQLEIYAAALSEALGMPVRQKLLYSFEHGEITVD